MAIKNGQASLSGIGTVTAVGKRYRTTFYPTYISGVGNFTAAAVSVRSALATLEGIGHVVAKGSILSAPISTKTRIKAIQIDSEASVVGYVLTSDGAGLADWEAPAGDISGSGADKYVAFFDGPSSITGSPNLQWDGKMLWFDRPSFYSWGNSYPPDIGLQGFRPAFAFCQDDPSAEPHTVVLYLDDDERFKLAWTPFRGVGTGGEANWKYDEKIDLIYIEAAIGWVGIGVGLGGSSYTLQLAADCTHAWANQPGQTQLALTGLTNTNLGLYMGVDTANEIARIQGASYPEVAMDLVLQPAGGNVGLGAIPTANMAGLSIEAGLLTLKERITPTADPDYGKIYPKSDNKLYFQDGAGVEHELAYA